MFNRRQVFIIIYYITNKSLLLLLLFLSICLSVYVCRNRILSAIGIIVDCFDQLPFYEKAVNVNQSSDEENATRDSNGEPSSLPPPATFRDSSMTLTPPSAAAGMSRGGGNNTAFPFRSLSARHHLIHHDTTAVFNHPFSPRTPRTSQRSRAESSTSTHGSLFSVNNSSSNLFNTNPSYRNNNNNNNKSWYYPWTNIVTCVLHYLGDKTAVWSKKCFRYIQHLNRKILATLRPQRYLTNDYTHSYILDPPPPPSSSDPEQTGSDYRMSRSDSLRDDDFVLHMALNNLESITNKYRYRMRQSQRGEADGHIQTYTDDESHSYVTENYSYPLNTIQPEFRRPTYYERYWLYHIVLIAGSVYVSKSLFNMWSDGSLRKLVLSSYVQLSKTVVERIVLPVNNLCSELFETISRHQEGKPVS